LGCLQVPLHPDLEIQVDVENSTNDIVSISLLLPHSVAAVQVFASATNDDAWPEVRDAIVAGLAQQHVDSSITLGRFGTEIHCTMPTQDEHGKTIVQPVKFVGIDGPRWFLRATVGGDAAVFPEAGRVMDDILASLIVMRGDQAMAPGEPLKFLLPAE
jgi:hypothetical protein